MCITQKDFCTSYAHFCVKLSEIVQNFYSDYKTIQPSAQCKGVDMW